MMTEIMHHTIYMTWCKRAGIWQCHIQMLEHHSVIIVSTDHFCTIEEVKTRAIMSPFYAQPCFKILSYTCNLNSWKYGSQRFSPVVSPIWYSVWYIVRWTSGLQSLETGTCHHCRVLYNFVKYIGMKIWMIRSFGPKPGCIPTITW